MKHSTINHLNLFHFYRVDRFAADNLRLLLAQLIETYLDQGDSMVLLSLDESQFRLLAQAYSDLLVGYKHPRTDSLSWSFRENDATLRRLSRIFRELRKNDTANP